MADANSKGTAHIDPPGEEPVLYRRKRGRSMTWLAILASLVPFFGPPSGAPESLQFPDDAATKKWPYEDD